MNNTIYAICGTAFFIAFAIVVAVYGGLLALPWIATALLTAGLSQFAAQGYTKQSQTASWVCIVIALTCSGIALGVTFGVAYFPVTP